MAALSHEPGVMSFPMPAARSSAPGAQCVKSVEGAYADSNKLETISARFFARGQICPPQFKPTSILLIPVRHTKYLEDVTPGAALPKRIPCSIKAEHEFPGRRASTVIGVRHVDRYFALVDVW